MDATSFLQPHAIGIVIGGSALALLVRCVPGDLWRALRALGVLGRRPWRAEPALEQIAALTRIARRNGVMTLDRSRIADPDIALAVAAIVDGEDAPRVRARLAHARDARAERHLAAADVWAALADTAPAMGMAGTLIGLVAMFAAMDDPATIGQAMAVALLTTLYGALIATLVAMPIAGRLRRLARAEAFERARLEGPLAELADREAPRMLEVAA